ncbi:autotransporter assembly complex protein TamA [Thiohalorhabdus sp.]|uniref:autotransporter assembly complex protein TamA n=1 Tax=Thiohalorhabdus sp. TaxID=3094134 RepID=UPI002FC33EAD
MATAVRRSAGPGPARAFVCLCLLLGHPLPAVAEEGGGSVEISGVSGEVRDNVRAYLGITDLAGSAEAEPEQVRRAHRQAPEEIRRALQPFGYYQPTVRANLATEAEGWTARYRVDPGPAVRIAGLEVAVVGPGADDDALNQVITDSALQRGERLHHGDYTNTKRKLIETAVQRGYLDAVYRRNELRVRPEAGKAEIHLVLASGPAYHFGDIRVVQEILAKDLVARMVPVQAGDRLTSGRLLDLQLALSDTPYFQRVNVDLQRSRAKPLHPEGNGAGAVAVPVVVATDPRASRKYSLGLGYGTDTGPRLSAGLELRRLNRSGHRFRTDLMVSAVRQDFSARYLIPIGDPRTDTMSFTGSYARSELGDGISHKYSVGISRDRRWRGWQRSIYTRYAMERFVFSDESQRSRLFTPGISLSRTRSDDPVRPRRGWSLFADVHGAHEDLLADSRFTQLRSRLQAVLGLGSRVRLLARLEVGANFTDDFAALPASERFFAGGARSVRGYAYQSLAPENAAGDVVGGQHLASGKIEADLRAIGNWGVAAFYDAGNAADDWPPEPKAGAGGGLRWFSPIGTIRLDYAVPLDNPDRDFSIHFSMGPDL